MRSCDSAKTQVNETWEWSTVPDIPVFGLLKGHIERLSELGIDDLVLSWTLGGAPSPNIKIASQYFFCDDGAKNDVLSSLYGENAEVVKASAELFARMEKVLDKYGFTEEDFKLPFQA